MKMKNENELLADMSIPKAFFRLALPAVAAQLINILYNLVDNCMTMPATVASIFTNNVDLIVYTEKSMRLYLA